MEHGLDLGSAEVDHGRAVLDRKRRGRHREAVGPHLGRAVIWPSVAPVLSLTGSPDVRGAVVALVLAAAPVAAAGGAAVAALAVLSAGVAAAGGLTAAPGTEGAAAAGSATGAGGLTGGVAAKTGAPPMTAAAAVMQKR